MSKSVSVPEKDLARVMKVLSPRDTVVSFRSNRARVAKWKKEAKKANMYFVDWIEMKLGE